MFLHSVCTIFVFYLKREESAECLNQANFASVFTLALSRLQKCKRNPMMKRGVSRPALLYIAGTIWTIAGGNILRIGLVSWQNATQWWLFKAAQAILVFLFFFFLIFRKLLEKHTCRIIRKKEKSCPLSFFDLKSWMVMGVMIMFGFSARHFGWFPNSFISFFYTGLGSALILTGILFLVRGKKLQTRLSATG